MTTAAASTTPAAQASATATPDLSGWLEVFRAGTHTDAKGKKRTFTVTDLDQMVANHSLGAAPVVLGHPQHNDPAYGWTAGLRREGDSLYAKFEQLHPTFEAGVASGAYRNRSLAVYPDPKAGWRVRHVGWLGAVPPAIDGLSQQAREFSAPADVEVLEFSAPGYSLCWGLESVVQLLRGLREQLIAKDGIEAADLVLPQWRIDSAMESAAQARREFDGSGNAEARAFSQPTNPEGAMTITEQERERIREEARAAAAAEAEARFAAQGAELAELRAERQAERIGSQINGWKAAGKVLPAEEAGLAEFMASLESAGEFTFSAPGTAGELKKTPADWFAAFMAARPPVVKLGLQSASEATAAQHVDLADTQAIVQAATEWQFAQQQKGITVSVEQAVQHVKDQQQKGA